MDGLRRNRTLAILLSILVIVSLILVSFPATTAFSEGGGEESEATTTPTPEVTPTSELTSNPTPEVTTTPEPTLENASTAEATVTQEVTPTPEPTATSTPEETATPEVTVTPEATSTPEPTASPTPIPEATPTPSPTPNSSSDLLPQTKLNFSSVVAKSDKDVEIESISKKIKLKMPKGAVSQDTDIELLENDNCPSGMLKMFQLNAHTTGKDKAEVKHFQKKLELTIQNQPEDLAGLDIDSLKLYYLDEQTHQWQPLSDSKFDKDTNTLTATTDHFSYYGEQANPIVSGPGKVKAAQVGLHSGTATYSYPIELPAGPGGFKPKLELTYDSGSVDEMKNKRDIGSWVGIGWTLHPGRISYSEGSGNYSLEVNGASYTLISNDGTNYYSKPDEFFKITRTGNTWEVWDKEGNYYQFGGTPDSQQYYRNSYGYYMYNRWDLSLFRDTNNNEATVSYVQDWWVLSSYTGVRAAYPEYLRYNNNLIEVHFISIYDYNDTADQGPRRADGPQSVTSGPRAPYVMDTRKLESIQIKVNGNLIRKYNFSYNTTSCYYSTDYGGTYYSGKHTLTSITEFGADGQSTLPITSFGYNDLITSLNDSGTSIYIGNPGNPALFNWPHITSINNGYGAAVTFSYTEKQSMATNMWTREVVAGRIINPGVGPYQTYQYTYVGDPQYRGSAWGAEYRGFGEVIETDTAGNYTEHWFYTGDPDDGDAEKLTGKEYKAEWHNADGTLLRQSSSDWRWRYTSENYSAIRKWGSYGTDINQFQGPLSTTVGSDGYIYVADTSNSRIKKFTNSGVLIASWGGYGSADGRFMNPYSVTAGSDGYVYVADTNNHRIQKFTNMGIFVVKWGTQGSGDGQFNYPSGIAIDSFGYVYVAEYGNNRVQKFTNSGTFVTKWGSSGSNDGQFSFNNYYTVGIVVDTDGYVYVADHGNNRIQKFTSSGTFVAKWGSSGSGDGQFNQPCGMATISDGYVYVAEYSNNRIQKFTNSGTFVTKWGSLGSPGIWQQFGGNEGFLHPSSVALGNDGYIYVADCGNNRIQKLGRLYTVYLNKVEETIGNKTTQTRYVYDNYGNVVTEYQDGDISTNTDDTTIYRVFNANATANIVSKPARERIYTTAQASDDGGANLRSETLYYYDGNNTSNITAPTKGNLTRVETKKDSSNSISTYKEYDIYGNVRYETDANGNVWETTWDSIYHCYPARIDSPPISGQAQSEYYSFDPGTGNLLYRTDVNGQTTSYEYDTFKRLTKVIKPGDSSGSPTVQYQYNNWGSINYQNLKTVTKVDADPNHSLWKAEYFDGLGSIIQVQAKGDTGHTIISSTTTFNNRGLVEKTCVSQDIASELTQYYALLSGWKCSTATYDGLGRTTGTAAADDTTTSTDYSIAWQRLVTNETGIKKRYTDDAFGHLIKVEELDASQAVYATTNYSYDTLGNLVQVIDNSNNTTSISYDWLSRKTAMTDPDMGTWSYGYDNNGNITSQTDAKSQTITLTYDALNRLTGKSYPAGSGMTNITYTYDSTADGNYGKGQRTSMTDAAGTTSYLYDSRGRTIQEKRTIDTADYITSYTYDAGGRLATVTYPTGEIVTQTYNNTGQLNTLSGSTAGNLVTGTLYNQLGQMTRINLGNGLMTTLGYYGVGGTYDTTGGYYQRLWEIKTSPQTGGVALQDVKYSWDAGGNMTQRENLVALETENFGYDFLDRLTSVSGAYTQSYAYNQIGNITSMNGKSYTYGAKPHAVTSVGTQNYVYDANGNMTDRSGQTITWDVENKPAAITWTANGGATYQEDFENAPGSEWSTYTSSTYGRNETGDNPVQEDNHSWRMDVTDSSHANLNELILHVTVSGASYLKLSFNTIEYNDEADALSNSFTGHYNGDGVAVSTDGTNWVKLWDYPASVSSWTAYNNLDVGSMVSITGNVYIKFQQYDDHVIPADGILWDDIGLDSDGTITPFGSSPTTGNSIFVYDGDGNRVKKTEGGQITLYINKYYEKNITSGVVTTHYFLGDREIAYNNNNGVRYVHQDSLGGTSVTTNSTGTMVGSIRYLPFGGTRSTSGTLDTDKLFTGQRLDQTGLYYYNARYYDATIGRFISPDTEGQHWTDPQSLNRYTYCLNSPLIYNDISGNWPHLHFSKIVKAVVAPIKETAVSVAKTATSAAKATVDAGKAVGEAVSNNINAIQTGLDIVGLVPVVGEVADAVNGAIYLARGDELNAALSLASCVPVAGNAATLGKLVNKVDNIADASKGFDSFKSLKKSLGSAGEGNEWHHIVEQCQIDKSGFDKTIIHNPGNAIAVDKATHQKITDYYNSIDRTFSGNMRVRDWLAGQSFDYQYEFGQQVLKQFGY